MDKFNQRYVWKGNRLWLGGSVQLRIFVWRDVILVKKDDHIIQITVRPTSGCSFHRCCHLLTLLDWALYIYTYDIYPSSALWLLMYRGIHI